MVPGHIAIIMDGNGRWAKKKGLPRIAGHQQGAEVVKSIIKACSNYKIKYLTLYTFSTENWKRPAEEVNFLMQFLYKYLSKEIQNLKENNIRFFSIGRLDKLPVKVQEIIALAKDQTKENTGLTLVLALNYGARLEIIDAALSLFKDIQEQRISSDMVTEEVFSRYLYTADIPDPDLLIRTSGEMRLSNFLLWQLSYAELYISDKFWPEFTEEDLLQAIINYQKRERRFGTA